MQAPQILVACGIRLVSPEGLARQMSDMLAAADLLEKYNVNQCVTSIEFVSERQRFSATCLSMSRLEFDLVRCVLTAILNEVEIHGKVFVKLDITCEIQNDDPIQVVNQYPLRMMEN